jgi:hypothetical protein
MKFILLNNGKYPYFQSMLGGKPIIGKGDYGIALKPDIKYGNKNYISKIFILPEYITIEEFEEFETKLNTIDQPNKYHVPLIDVEMINESHNLKELDDKDKKRYRCGRPDVYIATYEYGGLSIDNVIMKSAYNSIITPFFCKEILNGFLNLLDGIIFFSDNYLLHYDIHLGNIVIQLDRPSVMRFIDFNCKTIFRIRSYISDIVSLLDVIKHAINKFIEIFIQKDNLLICDYFQSILLILDSMKISFSSEDDIEPIPKIKQKLKEEFDKIQTFL